MGSCAAAGLEYVEVGGVGVSCKDHVAGKVGDAIVGIGGKASKELEHVSICVICGGGLLLGKLAEGYQEFFVDGSGIIVDGFDELLDAEFSSSIKRWASRSFCGVLKLCPIDDGGVTVRGVLRLLGVGVTELGAQVCDEVVHREAAGALGIVPSEVNSSI